MPESPGHASTAECGVQVPLHQLHDNYVLHGTPKLGSELLHIPHRLPCHRLMLAAYGGTAATGALYWQGMYLVAPVADPQTLHKAAASLPFVHQRAQLLPSLLQDLAVAAAQEVQCNWAHACSSNGSG